MNWKRITAIVVPLVLILSTILSCTPAVQIPGQIQDDLGRAIDITAVPERIVSLAPSNTEILFELGLGDKVVGVTDFCDYPLEVNDRCSQEEGTEGKITRVGDQLSGFNIETIVALEPDMALGFGYTSPTYVQQLEALGITVIILGPDGIDAILADIELVGKIMGIEAAAKQLTAKMREDILAMVSKTALISRPKVFYELDGTDPTKPWTAGPGSFVNDLISLAGGINIGAGGPTQGFQINTEEIVNSNPDIIILADVVSGGVTPESVADRAGWSKIAAIVNEEIHEIDPNITSRGGPRIVEALERLIEIIHPEIEL